MREKVAKCPRVGRTSLDARAVPDNYLRQLTFPAVIFRITKMTN
jgi:hypothetical protein